MDAIDPRSSDNPPIISNAFNPVYNYKFSSNSNEIAHLNIDFFKMHPCPSPNTHDRIHCPYYHCEKKDRKRAYSLYKYSSFMCPFTKDNKPCPYGDYCLKCHNNVELNYHPNNYKKRFCVNFPNEQEDCKFGKYCSYAHSNSEILVELLHLYDYDDSFFMFHFKTQFCPINHINHDRSLCVYAHNWQDFRRKPQEYNLIPEQCPNWNRNTIVLDYIEGCPNQFDCIYCHGWKELEYHPFVYKTKPCEFSAETCNRYNSCSHYHNPSERKFWSNKDKFFFDFAPRNRLIQGTNKVFLDDMGMVGVTGQNRYNELKENYCKDDSEVNIGGQFNCRSNLSQNSLKKAKSLSLLTEGDSTMLGVDTTKTWQGSQDVNFLSSKKITEELKEVYEDLEEDQEKDSKRS